VFLAGSLDVICCKVALVFLQVRSIEQLHTSPPGARRCTKVLQPCVCCPLYAAGSIQFQGAMAQARVSCAGCVECERGPRCVYAAVAMQQSAYVAYTKPACKAQCQVCAGLIILLSSRHAWSCSHAAAARQP
jgi:hypothetical protein